MNSFDSYGIAMFAKVAGGKNLSMHDQRVTGNWLAKPRNSAEGVLIILQFMSLSKFLISRE